ncbi:MAG TPA: POTRA domain-containing protein [Bacteroidia bacterium]
MKKWNRLFLGAMGMLLILASCSPTRKLADGERLLIKNKIERVNKKESTLDVDEYVFQKTNKKFLGIWRFNLFVYNLVNQEKMHKNQARKDSITAEKNKIRVAKGKPEKEPKPVFGQRLLKFGEPPAIYDSSLTPLSVNNMKQYLFNKGFFHANVTDSVEFVGDKKVIQHYFVDRGAPHVYRNITWIVDNQLIKRDLKALKVIENSPLKKGDRFDLDVLDEERTRIAKELSRKGYFFFNSQYVQFEADTGLVNDSVDLTLRIIPPNIQMVNNTGDTTTINNHFQCKIRHVYIEPDYQPGIEQKYLYADTFILDSHPYIILHNGNLSYKPRILAKQIIMEANGFYNSDDHTLSYNNLSSLRNFKYINIDYSYVEFKNNQGWLDCYVKLSPSKRQSFGFSVQGTTTGAYPGMEANFSYQNKNSFFGAEQLEFRVFARAESQIINDTTFTNFRRIFNTLEFGGELSLKFPKFLVPFNIGRYSKRNSPLTTMRIPLTYQTRPDYSRLLSGFNFGYEWNDIPYKKHRFNLAELSVIRVELSDKFRNNLKKSKDGFLLNSFTNQIILVTSYQYLFSNYKANTPGNFNSLRAGIEYGGNILYGLAKGLKLKQDTNGRYLIGYIPFAQYVKVEGDFRNFWASGKRSTLAFRAFVGIGVPYGNSVSLPFEKSYSAAGANDLRGFIARRMGPGSHYSGGLYDQFGDIKLMFSLEERLKLTNQIELGLYADAGNIWLLRKDASRENGEFAFNRFYKEFALSIGLGIRLNLGFFIFRLDPAIPVYNPAVVNNFDPNTTYKDRDPWRIKYSRFKDVRWNFAIGYPF